MTVRSVEVNRRNRELFNALLFTPVFELKRGCQKIFGELDLFLGPSPEPGKSVVGLRPERLKGSCRSAIEADGSGVKIQLRRVLVDQRGKFLLFLKREKGILFEVCSKFVHSSPGSQACPAAAEIINEIINASLYNQ